MCSVCVCECGLIPEAFAVRELPVKESETQQGFFSAMAIYGCDLYGLTHIETNIHTHTHTVPLSGLFWSWWQMEFVVITSSLTPACSVIPCNAQILLRMVGVCTVLHVCVEKAVWEGTTLHIVEVTQRGHNKHRRGGNDFLYLVCTQREAASV